MKKIILLVTLGVSTALMIVFLILVSFYRYEFLVDYFYLIISALLAIDIICLLFLPKKSFDADTALENRLKHDKGTKASIFIDTQEKLTKERIIERFLSGYICCEFDFGKLYYTVSKSIYNKKESSFTCIFFADDGWNTLDFKTEAEKRRELVAHISNHFQGNYLFIDCLVVNLYSELDREKGVFYRNFMGYVERESVKRGLLRSPLTTKHFECSDCAISLNNGECVHFFRSRWDAGTEADLSWLIIDLFL